MWMSICTHLLSTWCIYVNLGVLMTLLLYWSFHTTDQTKWFNYERDAFSLYVHLGVESNVRHVHLPSRHVFGSIFFPFLNMHSNGPYQMSPFVCMELKPLYSKEPICLYGIRSMRIYCQVGIFSCMELEYIRIIVKWELVYLHGIGMHWNLLMA